jgi:hypothetical protein
MSQNIIPEDKKAAILADMLSKRSELQLQLDRCLAKIKTDEDYLADFVMPKREMVRDTEEVEFYDLLRIKQLMNSTPDDIIAQWYFDGRDDYPITIKHDIEREMNDEEYAYKVQRLKLQHLASKRTVYERDLSKNIKGLKRNIEALTKTIDQISPPPTPEEDLRVSLARLEPGLRAEIMRKAERFALSKLAEFRMQQ